MISASKSGVLLTCQLLFRPSSPTLSVSISRVTISWRIPSASFFFRPAVLVRVTEHVWSFFSRADVTSRVGAQASPREIEHDCCAAGEKSADVCQTRTRRHGLRQLQRKTCVRWWIHVWTSWRLCGQIRFFLIQVFIQLFKGLELGNLHLFLDTDTGNTSLKINSADSLSTPTLKSIITYAIQKKIDT